VGTPPSPIGEADLSYVEAGARELALSLEGDKVFAEKNTMPARTCEAVERTMMPLRNRTRNAQCCLKSRAEPCLSQRGLSPPDGW
jgi:UDP-glucose 6-dehydrogenase